MPQTRANKYSMCILVCAFFIIWCVSLQSCKNKMLRARKIRIFHSNQYNIQQQRTPPYNTTTLFRQYQQYTRINRSKYFGTLVLFLFLFNIKSKLVSEWFYCYSPLLFFFCKLFIFVPAIHFVCLSFVLIWCCWCNFFVCLLNSFSICSPSLLLIHFIFNLSKLVSVFFFFSISLYHRPTVISFHFYLDFFCCCVRRVRFSRHTVPNPLYTVLRVCERVLYFFLLFIFYADLSFRLVCEICGFCFYNNSFVFLFCFEIVVVLFFFIHFILEFCF